MKLIAGWFLGAALALAMPQAEVELKAAAHKAEVEGDLEGARKAYQGIIANPANDRAAVARAFLGLAQCHEKLGQAEAAKLYRRITESYSDQVAVVTQARRRLAALGAAPASSALSARRLWVDADVDSSASLGPEGTELVMVHWASGDLALRDLATGRIERLNLKTSWTESASFGEWPVLSRARDVAYAWFSAEDRNYQLRIVAALSGAKPRILVRSADFEYFQPAAWSTDGKSILAGVWHRGGAASIAWISVADGSMRVLKSFDEGRPERIALSPDGRYIAYSVAKRQDSRDRDIYVLSASGNGETAAVAGPDDEYGPSWAPGGARLVYSSDRSGRMDLWSVAVVEGKCEGTPRVAKADIGLVAPLGFTPSGTFHYVHERSEEDVFSLAIDPATGRARGSAVRITQSFFGENDRPAWSPDGKWIAFYSRRGHARFGPGAISLVVRSPETGEEKVFPWNGITVTPQSRPVWLHRGLAVLEAGYDRKGDRFFRKVDVASGNAAVLAVRPPRFRAFVLTPDDSTVYLSMSVAEKPGLVRMDLSTSRQAPIEIGVPGGGASVRQLVLDPQGRRLAVTLERQGTKYRQQVAVVDVDGSGLRILDEGEPGLVPLLALAMPAGSRWTYFVRAKRSGNELWRVDPAGGTPEFTGISAAGLRAISFSPDGSRLAFTAGQRADPEHWVLENLLPAMRASR